VSNPIAPAEELTRALQAERIAGAEARTSVAYLARQVEHEGAAQQRTWRVLGGEGSAPNADAVTEAAERTVAELREAQALVADYRRAAVDVSEALDGERQEPDFDMPGEFAAYAVDCIRETRNGR